MIEQLNRAGLPWERADYGATKTYETIKRPFSPRFAYWAGYNFKLLFQMDRMDERAAAAYAQGWQDATDEINEKECFNVENRRCEMV